MKSANSDSAQITRHCVCKSLISIITARYRHLTGNHGVAHHGSELTGNHCVSHHGSESIGNHGVSHHFSKLTINHGRAIKDSSEVIGNHGRTIMAVS